jgi:hypothetical protein
MKQINLNVTSKNVEDHSRLLNVFVRQFGVFLKGEGRLEVVQEVQKIKLVLDLLVVIDH